MSIEEISHSELQKWHYQALKNPQYQLGGMMSVLTEELMMSIPNFLGEEKPKEVITPQVIQPSYFLQRLNELEGKLHKHIDKKRKGRYY